MAHQFTPGEKLEWQVPAEHLTTYGAPADEPNPQVRFFAVMTALDAAIGRLEDVPVFDTLLRHLTALCQSLYDGGCTSFGGSV